MNKELKSFLEDVKQNPSSGVSGNAKMTRAQVEQIFALDRLTEEVQKLNKSTSRYSKILVVLTYILFFIAVMQFIATISLSLKNWWQTLAIMVVFFTGILFLIRKVLKDYKD